MFYVSPTQVNFLVPLASPGPASITITAKDGTVTKGDMQIGVVSPGIFQLDGSTALAAANVVRVKSDQSQSIESVYQAGPAGEVRALPIDLGPATDQIYLTLWGTGILQAKSVAVTVGGQEVGVLYWGPQRLSAGVNLAGVEQLNIGPLPRSLAGCRRGKYHCRRRRADG